MNTLNGDAPVRYRISQGDKKWVVKLAGPDEDAAKLKRWVADNDIEGEIIVSCEWRDGKSWKVVGPVIIADAGIWQ